MSRKTILTIIITIFILIVLGLLWWLIWGSNNEAVKPIRDRVEYFLGISRPSNGSSTTTPNIIDVNETFGSDSFVAKLRQIYKEPIAGAVIFDRIITTTSSTTKTSTSTETAIRFIDRANGNVFETRTNTTELKRLVNKTTPKVYEAKWNKDGSRVLLKQLDDTENFVKTFEGEIKTSTSTDEKTYDLTGSYIRNGLLGSTISPDAKNVFTLEENALGGASGFIKGHNSTTPKQIYTSFFREWLVDWPSENIIAINSKPAYGSPGYLYFINPQTGASTPIVGDILGLLSNVSPDGKYVFFSGFAKNKIYSFAYNVKEKTSFPVDSGTIPEKCAWSNNTEGVVVCGVPVFPKEKNYPDEWYKGKIFFNDEIWIFDLISGNNEKVAIPQDGVGVFDIINPQLSKDDNFLLFQNKKDLSLWILDLRK